VVVRLAITVLLLLARHARRRPGDGRRRAPCDAERGDGVPLLPSDPHPPAGGH